MEKKGQLDLPTVQAFIVLLLILGVIAIAMFVGLTALSDTSVIARKDVTNNTGFTNLSVTVNSTGSVIPAPIAALGTDTSGYTYTGFLAFNGTGNSVQPKTPFNANGTMLINVGNFTVNSDGSITTTLNGVINGSAMNLTISGFTATKSSDAVLVSQNVTSGVTEFFNDIPTALNILGVVVIILAVLLIILAVRRFEGMSEKI